MSIELEQYKSQRSDGPSGPNRMMRILGIVALVAGLFGVAYVGTKWLASIVNDVIAGENGSAIAPGDAVTIQIAPGESASQIARELADEGVVQSAAAFDRAVRERRAADRLQAGTYELETGMDPDTVLDILLEGPTREVYRLTVIEGLTIGQMLESIERQTGYGLEALTGPLLDGSVESALLPDEPEELRDWEGLLFPDTYEFDADASPVDILTRMAETAEDRVGSVDWSVVVERDLTPYDGIIVASMIEREALLDEERAVIASVIYNRLEQGIPLQIDATVIYALGAAPEGGLTGGDLEVDSPYNTYRIAGLPPTPIAGPRLASLRAASAPADTSFLYYVLIDESGRHAFTDDFDEFLELQEQAREAGLIP